MILKNKKLVLVFTAATTVMTVIRMIVVCMVMMVVVSVSASATMTFRITVVAAATAAAFCMEMTVGNLFQCRFA